MWKKSMAFHRLGIEGNFLNLSKNVYKKSTANIIFNDERLNTFPLSLRPRQGCLLSPLPIQFNVILKVLASTISQVKEIRSMQIGKEKITVLICMSLHHDHLHRKFQRIYKNLPEPRSKFSRITGYKVNKQKSIIFLHTSNE